MGRTKLTCYFCREFKYPCPTFHKVRSVLRLFWPLGQRLDLLSPHKDNTNLSENKYLDTTKRVRGKPMIFTKFYTQDEVAMQKNF